MKRKALFVRIIGALVAVVALVIVGAYVIFPLAANGKLPGQKQPTPIPVTPFANVNSAAAPGTTVAPVSASGTTATPAAASGSAVAASGTTYTIAADQSEAKVTVNEKLAFLPSNSDAVLTTKSMQG
jgi:hypothetical protein